MQDPPTDPRPITLPDNAFQRAMVTLGRGLLRHCPYCGGGRIFRNWFTLKERCPHCHTLFAYEDGYFLGSYVFNLVLTSLIAIAAALYMLIGTDFSVLRMQVVSVVLVVILPLVLYPYCLSFWMTLDLLVHPPGDFSDRPRT
ncbi:MAG TPA: DUF983 domain-containing protein [Thermomicrobiales bacterium]|nr:DUF983 domain-containing protein [Thermomicrobiales bacterium]